MQSTADASLSADAGHPERTMSKVMRRIIPFVFICYVVSYIDRVNVGFAALTMNRDLGLTPAQFGFGAGLFFIGYFLFEIPSNLIMQRVGARVWIARIMITWGLISMATAFVVGPYSFALARFLLGISEAGFTPGIYLYFTHWFPGKWRAKATAAFLVGIPTANIVGSPISGALVSLGGVGGLKGWQWLLVVEAAPAVLLGIACLFILSDRPEKASWLDSKERAWLASSLAAERKDMAARHGSSLRDAFTNWRLFALAFINFCGIVGSVGIGLWLPQIIKELGLSATTVGFVTAVPYLVGAVAMTWWARLASNSDNRIPYVVGALMMAALALAVSTQLDAPLLKLTALAVAVSSILSFQSTFWAIPSGFLTGSAAAGGLALIVSIGNLGGFAGPSLVGLLKDATHGFTYPLIAVSSILFVGALTMLALGDPARSRSVSFPSAARA
jgi:ACS family tartrate transporter-like MFS transporter